ncbi:MAG: hypothetical protein ACRYG7_41910 [Janthinobacterium lividum]
MDSSFNINAIDKFLSPFHSLADKERIYKGLAQFTRLGQLDPKHRDYEADVVKAAAGINASYSEHPFYSEHTLPYFLQGDVLPKVKLPLWNSTTGEFSTGKQDALIISNACDCDLSNSREVPKTISLVPIYPLDKYLENVSKSVTHKELSKGQQISQASQTAKDKVEGIRRSIQLQQFTNVFFMPATKDGSIVDRIALLDRPFFYDSREWNSKYNELLTSKEASLSMWAYYLFVFKLSFHLCRLPEEPERKD